MHNSSCTDFTSVASFSLQNESSTNCHTEGLEIEVTIDEPVDFGFTGNDAPKKLRRIVSDPTVYAARDIPTGTERIERSVGDLRQCSPVGDNWEEVKRHFADAILQDREISRETERENMHFYLSEMLISAMEKMNWRSEIEAMERIGNIGNWSGSSNLESLRPANSNSSLGTSNGDLLRTGSSTFYASMTEIDDFYDRHDSFPCEEAGENGEVGNDEYSAEATTSSLLKHFSAVHPPERNEDAQWLMSCAQAPQTLLHLSNDFALHTNEVDNRGKPIRLRGSKEWAPPRKQWIFSLPSAQLSLKRMMELQNDFCAGCGIKVSKLYARRMQLCNYYNKLFCPRCHQGAKMRIPARIMHQWNFREFPVSDIARRFLLDNYSLPVINALAVDPNFYERFKSLRHNRVLRLQLVHLWSFIRHCNLAKSTVTAHGTLHALYSSIPKHLLDDADVYSMVDLENVRSGNLVRLIEPLVKYGKCHVNSCEHCQAKGFVCELCDQRDDLLFPFQLSKVDRCAECGSLSHAKCAARRMKQSLPCPKCVRIALNSARHRHQSEASGAATNV